VPDVFTLASTPPLLGEIDGTFSLPVGGGTITGTYTDVVLVDPFGITCSGCLDFAIQVSINPGSSGVIDRVFNGGLLVNSLPAATDVGYASGTGSIAPTLVNYGPAGEDMGFTVSMGPGASTDFLVIATDATSYKTDDVSAAVAASTGGILQLSGTIGASTANDVGMAGDFFVPVATTEPSTLWLTAAGLLGLMGMALLRKRQA
jgi:hypothetical protein